MRGRRTMMKRMIERFSAHRYMYLYLDASMHARLVLFQSLDRSGHRQHHHSSLQSDVKIRRRFSPELKIAHYLNCSRDYIMRDIITFRVHCLGNILFAPLEHGGQDEKKHLSPKQTQGETTKESGRLARKTSYSLLAFDIMHIIRMNAQWTSALWQQFNSDYLL